MTSTVLVLGGRIQTVRKAVGAGLRVVLVQHREHFVPESAELAEAVVIADYTDWDVLAPLVDGLHRAYGFSRVVTLTEPGLVPAGRIAERLGLPGNPARTCELLTDKLGMRDHLNGGPAADLSVPAAEVDDAGSLRAFGAEHGYPFVVKPVDATASLGVWKVTGPAGIQAAADGMAALRARTDLQWGSFFRIGRFLAERYIPGPEFSVEAFSFDGRHVVLAVTEKFSDGALELGHAQPARLDAADEEAITAAAVRFLDAMGLTTGPSHTEIRLAPDGAKVIEGHNRIGGDRIVDLLEAAYGADLELWTITWPFGLMDPVTQRPEPKCSAATRFLTAAPGTVTEVRGADKAAAAEGALDVDLLVGPGSTVNALTGNWDRVGQVIATGPDTDTAVATCDRMAEAITITTHSSTKDTAAS
ncbi:ATP-grasp domain-containing protein [Streptomyces montanisoli]|uniref:ATP-grasp domain-containing protein n=1 Tax=Streptomyces montanisoli TaxID=2798581 RepID=A0A940MCH1_9ACTN|nr:ATP-grasp domain-containing protein [Streptomyces montanisoli]MBP0460440.1 ATP-grasp domain-containing protein [Streptomyces montanisoli]